MKEGSGQMSMHSVRAKQVELSRSVSKMEGRKESLKAGVGNMRRLKLAEARRLCYIVAVGGGNRGRGGGLL
jgi:hypothetical protein